MAVVVLALRAARAREIDHLERFRTSIRDGRDPEAPGGVELESRTAAVCRRTNEGLREGWFHPGAGAGAWCPVVSRRRIAMVVRAEGLEPS